MSKAMVLFYSFEGSTKEVGQYLSRELVIPYEEIRPVKDLNSKGFIKYIVGGGQVIRKKKPELMEIKAKLENYDTVFLGSPIWAGSFTPAIRTLLESGALKDKNIAFFYTSKGGPGKAESKIEEQININNKLVAIYGLANVENEFEDLKEGLLNWAKSVCK